MTSLNETISPLERRKAPQRAAVQIPPPKNATFMSKMPAFHLCGIEVLNSRQCRQSGIVLGPGQAICSPRMKLLPKSTDLHWVN